MGKSLDGKAYLVTGAAVRLGKAIALRLGREGARVAVHYRSSRAQAEHTAEEIERSGGSALVVQADLTSAAQVSAMFDRVRGSFGQLHGLVNSAALFERRPVREISDQDFQRVLEVNLTAPFRCCREALSLLARPGGAIVNMVDIGGALVPWTSSAHYCASKAGLAMLTRCLALELASEGIRVNAIAPGAVLFPEATPPEERQRLTARIPLGRTGTPEEVAEAAFFLLAGPEFVTGQVLAVDGGRSLGPSPSA